MNLKYFLLALLIPLSLTLSGCGGSMSYLDHATIDYKVDIQEDGTEQASIRFEIPTSELAFGADKLINNIKSELLKEGYFAEAKTENGKTIIQGTRMENDKNWVIPYGLYADVPATQSLVQDDPIFIYNYKDYFFFRSFDIDLSYAINQQSVTQLKQYVDNIILTYTINVPGTITQTNANAVQNNSAKWSIDLANDQNVSLIVHSRVLYKNRIAVLLILLALPTFYFIRKRYLQLKTE